MYHGSNKLIKNTLLPFPSKVVDNEEKVFATISKGFALMFMGKRWNDDDIEFGSRGPKHLLYAIERKKDVFKKTFSGKTGYLYKVSAKQFHSDERLGMKYHEYIADKPVNILPTHIVKDVYKELIKSDIQLFTYDKIKFIYFNQNKYNSDIINIGKFNYDSLNDIVTNINSYKKKNIVVNGIIDNKNMWGKIYYSNRNDVITKIGLVKINKYNYKFIIYNK
jgi:hypothetical protein